MSDSEVEDAKGAEEEDKIFTELAIQMSFDIFSFLSQRASFDQDTAIGSQQDFISAILNSFTKNQAWNHVKWVKFILMLIVCNGGSLSAQGGMMDFEETVQTRFMKLMMDHISNKGESQSRNMLDFEMLTLLINNVLNELLFELSNKSSN